MTALAGEISKICAYSGADEIVKSDIDAVTEPVLDAVVFQMTDLLGQGEYGAALVKLQQLLKMQQEPIAILGAVGGHFRKLSTARTLLDNGRGAGELMKLCGMGDYPARKTMSAAGRFSARFCAKAAELVMETDYKMKTSFDDNERLLELLILQLAALCLRTALDSEFVIRQKREMMIVESMKVSQMEFSATSSKLDEIYKDIYERVVLHFEMEKPFLNGNLSINDVVRVVYSNKVYISKAICHYTGRNFCQFVNYYRVIYSMEIFRKQPGLKVAELAGLSGFNCTVSFTTAFRLFMNETPSEWCRKERTKLLKTKN